MSVMVMMTAMLVAMVMAMAMVMVMVIAMVTFNKRGSLTASPSELEATQV